MKKDRDHLGTWGLVPGDGLIVAEEHGVSLRRVGTPSSTFSERVPGGTVLIVVEGDAGTAGVHAVSTSGEKYVVTTIDVIVGAVSPLTRGGAA